MKRISQNSLSAVLLSALTLLLLLIGCKEDPLSDPINNDVEGAVTVKLLNKQKVDNFFNLYFEYGIIYLESEQGRCYFADFGAIKSLANVKSLPLDPPDGSVYRSRIEILPNCGYIAYVNDQYYRIFVVGVDKGATPAEGGTAPIESVTIQYQKPFYGADEDILLKETSITVDPRGYNPNGSSREIHLQNKSIIPITIESSAEWCRIEKQENYNYKPLGYFRFTCEPNPTTENRKATLTLKTHYGKTKTIEMTQTALDQPIVVNPTLLSFDAKNTSSQRVTVESSVISDWTATSNADWCIVANKQYNSFEVRANNNTSGQNRTAQITIKHKSTTVKTIEVKQNHIAIGDYYKKGGVEGVVFDVDGDHGKILSMDKSAVLAWSTEQVETGAMNQSDGSVNMARIKLISDWQNKYPIFNWCEQRNTNGVSGWYVPSKDELSKIMSNKTEISTTLIAYPSGSPIINDVLWSSTESSYSSAYGWGSYNNLSKSTTQSVRAVMKF